MTKYLLLGFLLTAFISIAEKETAEKKIIGAILKQSPEYPLEICTYEGVTTNTWPVTEEMVQTIQPVLIQHIKNKFPERLYTKIENYRCQYVGIVMNGHHQIYCGFSIYGDDIANWKEFPCLARVDELDAGTRYFYFVYDIKEGKCKNIVPTGPGLF